MNWKLYECVSTTQRRKSCESCGDTIEGKNKEAYFHYVATGGALSLCAKCLRKFAADIDKQNKNLQNGRPSN